MRAALCYPLEKSLRVASPRTTRFFWSPAGNSRLRVRCLLMFLSNQRPWW